MTEAILAACIQLNGKFTCEDANGGGTSNSIVKVYTSIVDDTYSYRFGVVGKWDFLADGISHPMSDWPYGSAYRAVCSETNLIIEQLREKPGRSAFCGGFANRIVYTSHFNTNSFDEFSFTQTESHHCADGRIVEPKVTSKKCHK